MRLLPFDEYIASLPRKRMAAGVLYRDDAGRVLLVKPSYKPGWEIPGGAVEADEAPWHTASREAREEVGIDRPLHGLLVIDYTATEEKMPEGVSFVFNGGLVTAGEVASLRLTDPEIVAARLVTTKEVEKQTQPRLARRIHAAIDAVDRGVTMLCEHGKAVPS